MIEIEHLVKSFDGRVILNDISAVFETGKTNLIIGRSGSGKTVTVKSIIGLVKPERGRVLYDGRDLLSMNKSELKHLRRETGVLFQGSALFAPPSLGPSPCNRNTCSATSPTRASTRRRRS